MATRLPQPPPGWVTDAPGPVVSVPARAVAERADTLGAFLLVAVVWVVVIGCALLVLRAVVAEDLDREQR